MSQGFESLAVVRLVQDVSGLGRVYQNCLMDATLIEKPAPTNLLMRIVQDFS